MSGDLVWALKNGQLEDVKAHLATPEDVNRELDGGRTALNIAADYGHNDIVEYLIEQGADVNGKDKFGNTPLISAIFEGHEPCVKLLIEKGADKSCKGPQGQTALECCETDTMKALLK